MAELKVQTVKMYRTPDGELHSTQQGAVDHQLESDFCDWYRCLEDEGAALSSETGTTVHAENIHGWLQSHREDLIKFLS